MMCVAGLHVRNNAAFQFVRREALTEPTIDFTPVKIFTVKSGGVAVCYINGRAKIFEEGRYAVNMGSFVFGPYIR